MPATRHKFRKISQIDSEKEIKRLVLTPKIPSLHHLEHNKNCP